MSKNNDLSNLLSKKNDHIRKRHTNHPRFYNSQIQSNELNENGSKTPNFAQKKVAEYGLRAAGVPKGLAKNLSNNESVYKLVNNSTLTLKMPLPVKITIASTIILGIFILLMIFIVIFGGGSKGYGSIGSYTYGKTCTKITVNDTDCDETGKNCTNQYSGEFALEDYVAGVVASISKNNNNIEYLKLLATTARTYLLKNVGDSCIVEGNNNFQEYMDVNDNPNSQIIKQAVTETKNYIFVENEDIIDIEYGYGNIVDEDNNSYQIGLGSHASKEVQIIPKSWTNQYNEFNTYLQNWQTESESDTELSLIGALYLIKSEGYNYQKVIKYYHGEDVEVVENEMILSGNDGFINPTRKIHCTSPFGWRIHPIKKIEKFHSGLDIGIAGGEPIFAAKDGVVTRAETNITLINDCSSSYGNVVIIKHDDGTETLYSHMKYGSIPSYIYVGAYISQGQQVGAVGSTGCSTGNHLHYEVRLNGERVDPTDYMDLTNATGTCKK